MIDQICLRLCQIVPRSEIKNCSVPLHLLYVELVKQKDIVPLAQLSEKEKRSYWNQTEGDRFQRIIIASALYLYDVITKP